MNEEMKTAVNEATVLIEEINTILNKAIAKNPFADDTDRRTLRTIRDKNIQTYLKVQELNMVGLLE